MELVDDVIVEQCVRATKKEMGCLKYLNYEDVDYGEYVEYWGVILSAN